MKMIDNYINPERILTYYEALTISKKEYIFLKQLAQIERENIQKENNNKLNNKEIAIKLMALRFNTPIYPNLSSLKKEIILANAILPDDYKIINTLNEYGFNIYHLKTIIRFRGIIKNLIINNSLLTKELKENIKIYKRVTTKLIDIFNKEFNCNNSTIILNRISEILITYPDLLETNFPKRKL